jgi:hypothetical protein
VTYAMNLEILPLTNHHLRTEKWNSLELEKSALMKSPNAVQIVIVMKIRANLNLKLRTICEELAIAPLNVVL